MSGREGPGTYRCYVTKDFNKEHLTIIGQVNEILIPYEDHGHCVTLRQLYYQMVVRNWIPNTQASYNRLGGIVSDARLAGLVSWTALEDRTRSLKGHETFDSPQEAIKSMLSTYRLDLWHDQPFRPEVWVEKAAMEGFVASVCSELRVDFFACRGYNSQSEQWRAGQRFHQYVRNGQRPIVFHLGDHDPSGIDMTRDNRDRLTLFAGVPVIVQRLALNWPQIEELKPPPNPAKMTDSRAADYVEEFGYDSWEMDALPPEYIHTLIRDAVLKVRDDAKWEVAMAEETHDRLYLEELAGSEQNND